MRTVRAHIAFNHDLHRTSQVQLLSIANKPKWPVTHQGGCVSPLLGCSGRFAESYCSWCSSQFSLSPLYARNLGMGGRQEIFFWCTLEVKLPWCSVRPGLGIGHIGRARGSPRATSNLRARTRGAAEETLSRHRWGNSRCFCTWMAKGCHHLPRPPWHAGLLSGRGTVSAFLFHHQVGLLPFPSILHLLFSPPVFTQQDLFM